MPSVGPLKQGVPEQLQVAAEVKASTVEEEGAEGMEWWGSCGFTTAPYSLQQAFRRQVRLTETRSCAQEPD